MTWNISWDWNLLSSRKLNLKSFNSPLQIKSLEHRSQWNGRSALAPLLWDLIWKRRLPFKGKAFGQTVHTKGLSVVWVLAMCDIKFSFLLKILSQIWQLWESELCWDMWDFKCSFLVKIFWQYWHLCGESLEESKSISMN